MKKEEVEPYLNRRVKIILKGSGNFYQGLIIRIKEDSFVIKDKYDEEVTVDYELCGLITPISNGGTR